MAACAFGCWLETSSTLAAESSDSKPTLLMFHAGGFIFGSTELLQPAAEQAEAAGFDPLLVEYPLYDMPGAVRKAERVALRLSRRGREAYAYGESAGGTLAALLAQRGLVRASATYSQVSNVVQLANHSFDPELYQALLAATDRQMRRSSPALRRTKERVLALTPVRDLPYLNRSTGGWDHREKLVRSVDVRGGHIGSAEPRVYAANVNRALGWLQLRTRAER